MTDAPVSRIRNFCIIAHIDHGKSTLADRLLQDTGTVANRDMQEQFLDNMDLERERGITIKLQAARMNYTAADGEEYVLNLIDTPGHVDFSYEVSRSLLACEGALLVVDASQGVEAQTLANVYLALENDLEIIPVLNKIDLPGADPDRIKEEVEAIIGLDCSKAIPCSAKTGLGVPEILQAVVDRVPAPKDAVDEPTKALIFDSYYDPYRGVIVYFRVMSGRISCKDKVLLMASKKTYELDEIGVMAPDQRKVDELHAGEVGYLAASIKAVADALPELIAAEDFSGFQPIWDDDGNDNGSRLDDSSGSNEMLPQNQGVFKNQAYWLGHPDSGYGASWNEPLTLAPLELPDSGADFTFLTFDYFAEGDHIADRNGNVQSVRDFSYLEASWVRDGEVYQGIIYGSWTDLNENGLRYAFNPFTETIYNYCEDCDQNGLYEEVEYAGDHSGGIGATVDRRSRSSG